MILILGNPGAGKTTQTNLLAEYLGCPWFSMGELIRNNVTGKDRQDMMDGKIISDEVTMAIVEKVFSSIDLVNQECVFEGNPRSIPQAKWWLDQQAKGKFKITGLIHMVADPAVAEDRLVKRGRIDDVNEEVIHKRYAEYRRSITPTLDYLKQNGVNVHEINANEPIESVSAAIHKALGIE